MPAPQTSPTARRLAAVALLGPLLMGLLGGPSGAQSAVGLMLSAAADRAGATGPGRRDRLRQRLRPPPPPPPPPADAAPFSWETMAPAPLGRSEAQGAAVNGKLYVFGGFFSGDDDDRPV